MTKGISVIICCHNSEGRILTTLEHLSVQKRIEGLDIELIVVDNNCTDKTVEVVFNFWKNLNITIPLHLVKEKEPGLSFARLAGAKHAKHEYIIFCDDDNWLDENYVSIALKTMEADSKYAACGGWSDPAFDKRIIVPDWFNEHKNSYAVGKQHAHSADITPRGYLWGAGIVVRRSLFLEVCNKQYPLLLTGRKGSKLSSGEDSEICLRFILMGYNLYYNDQLYLKHFIPAERLTEQYKEQLFIGLNQSLPVLHSYMFLVKLYKTAFLNRLYVGLSFLVKIVSSIIKAKANNSYYEKRGLFFLTGIRFKLVSDSDIAIRQIFKHLKSSKT